MSLRFFFDTPLKTGVSIATMFWIVVGAIDVLLIANGLEFADVWVEVHGLGFDLMFFGVLLLWLDQRRQKIARVDLLQMELEKMKSSSSVDAVNEKSFLIARLLKDQSEPDLSDHQLPGISLKGMDLRGVKFVASNLQGADFTDSDLGNASFWLANLKGAKMGKKLTGVTLIGAEMEDSILKEADLREASFGAAKLTGADLRDADLRGADFSRYASFDRTDLRGANLTGLNLRGRDLTLPRLQGAKLQNANLAQVNLRGADLSEIDLSSSNLEHADLRDCDLDGANFFGANLSEAKLAGVTNVDVVQLRSANNWNRAIVDEAVRALIVGEFDSDDGLNTGE